MLNKLQLLDVGLFGVDSFIDDEKYMGDVIINNLAIYHYDITFVTTIPDFIEKINNGIQYDLFILDIMIPIKNEEIKNLFSLGEISEMGKGLTAGEVLYKRIRNQQKFSKTPILFYSGIKPTIETDNFTNAIIKPQLATDLHKEIQKMIVSSSA